MAYAQEKSVLQQGIDQYQQENYEEAIELFTKVRRQEPASSQTAFFLGMAYKQVQDYQKAAVHLGDREWTSSSSPEKLQECV